MSNPVHRQQQSGFTAVELLITLFVAAAFLIAAYQLFNVIIKDGGNARAQARAASVANDYLRRYSESATSPCTSSTLLSNSPVTIAGLNNTTITVTMSCMTYGIDTISKIQAAVTYNTPAETVTYTTYVDKSSGATGSTDITDGLVGWWKLNGNANSSVGNNHGTITGATLTTGQGGLANGAYNFNGSSQYISIPSTFDLGVTGVTLAAWVNSSTSSNSGTFIKVGNLNGSGNGAGYGMGVGGSSFYNSTPGTKIILLYENVRTIVTTADLGTGWHHVAMVIGTDGIPSAYKDGSLINSYSGTGAQTPSTAVTTIGGAVAQQARFFTGSIDDARVYSRALDASEISSLYSQGAK